MIHVILFQLKAALRQRYLHSVFGVSFLMVVLVAVAGELSMAEHQRIAIDFGFSIIYLVALGIAVGYGGLRFVQATKEGIWSLFHVHGFNRAQMVISQTIVSWLHVLGFVLVSSAVLRGYIGLSGFTVPEMTYWSAVAGVLFEAAIISQISILLSLYTRPLVVVAGGLAFSFIGHSVGTMVQLASKQAAVILKVVSEIVRTTLPHFQRLDFRPQVADQLTVAVSDVAGALGYGLLWGALLMVLTILAFKKRELI